MVECVGEWLRVVAKADCKGGQGRAKAEGECGGKREKAEGDV